MHANDAYAPRSSIEGVLHAFTRIGRRLKARQPGDTIDHSAHVVLFALRCHGAQRLSDLAARLELDASTTSRHVRALEQAGLLHRSADQADGRASRVELSDQGHAEWEAAAARRTALLAKAMEGWSEQDISTFESLMTRFADGVVGPAGPGPGGPAGPAGTDPRGDSLPRATHPDHGSAAAARPAAVPDVENT